jgi:thiol-disulfide isomerase/thioredoxin
LRILCCILAALVCSASLAAQPAKISPQEQQDLEQALNEAGAGAAAYLRALERHLAKYPDSPRKEELERAAVRAAIEVNDDSKIALYGERLLERRPDDLQILERVTRSLLADDSREASERARKYARRYQQLAREMRQQRPRDAEWLNQSDRAIGRALCYEARAAANLGSAQESLDLARQAFEIFPDAESAREIAHGYERLAKYDEASRAMADAFTIADSRATDADRARDRGRLGELYRKAHGSEGGLGDLVLEAYDRNLALVHARELRLRASDPNAALSDPMQFTLGGVGGAKLAMSSLKGKVVIFDFSATWCGPCRAQHPLYQAVKQKFAGNPNVVFLSVNTDEDRDLVAPFLAEVKWRDPVYFEDGLARALKIATIPTTVIVDRAGRLFSRMNGYVPESFVESLTRQINEALIVP